MFKKITSNTVWNFLLLAALCLAFYACEQQEPVEVVDTKIEQTIFQKYLADNTQKIAAADLGEGNYELIGASGTVIEIEDALVDNNGKRVRGAIEIELIEIYTAPEMILNRKQTLSNDNGVMGILESGGEVFVKAYQDGKELSLDGTGSFTILLPTENTGGARDDMEVYLGEEIGAQVIWTPTGEKVRVIYPESRNSEAFYMVQDILGWINVDILSGLSGSDVDCFDVVINCELCEDGLTFASIYVNSLNSAFEIPMVAPNQFQLCGPYPIGGVTLTLIVVTECPDGTLMVVIKTITVSPGNHMEVVECDDYQLMDLSQLEVELNALL